MYNHKEVLLKSLHGHNTVHKDFKDEKRERKWFGEKLKMERRVTGEEAVRCGRQRNVKLSKPLTSYQKATIG